jgi:hypothetical protein
MTLYGAPFADPLRPWETDVDVLPYREPSPRGLDRLDVVALLTAWWVYVSAAIAAALVAVLVVIGIRRFA